MAYYKIEKNTKGLVAKINVCTKDIKTGKKKIITKRIYNSQNLSDTKFEKFVEKCSLEFEDEVQEALNNKTSALSSKVLTFEQLSKEFLDNIRANLSMSYYIRGKEVVEKFSKYLKDIGLSNEPISSIRVRDIQIFLNSWQTYTKHNFGKAKLKKPLPENINYRMLAREGIMDRCTSYEMKRQRISISKEKALKLCEYCSLNFNEYFLEVDDSRQYSAETIKGYRRVLRTIFNEAIRYEWITRNPVSQTKIGAGNSNSTLTPVHEKQVYSIREAKEFLEAADKMDDDLIYKKTIFKFMLLTGVRIGEMCGLKWSDIDFTKKVVHIIRSRMYCKELGDYEKVPKTRTSVRDIPLTDYLIDALEKYKKWFRLADDDFDSNMDNYYLAVNPYREKVHKDVIGHWLSQFEKQNGLKHIPCHGLRHTYCSLLLAQNVPIQTVSRYMGHSDSTITLKVYSHFIPDTQEKVVNALNNIV